jgi:hypothetical protein
MPSLMALLLIATMNGAPATPAAASAVAVQQDCLPNRDIKVRRLSAEQGYFARTSRGWWRNLALCPAYGPNRALITRGLSDRQCRGDIVTIVDPFTRMEFGGCGLGAWQQVADDEVPPAKHKQ